MAPRITGLRAHDVRFPTSDGLHGSDAMNPDPDYSAAVAIVETDGGTSERLCGHGLTFTIGRGNEISSVERLAMRSTPRPRERRDAEDRRVSRRSGC